MSGGEIEFNINDQKFWDAFAGAQYESTAHRFTTFFAERALEPVTLPQGSRVLDIATGTGALAIAAAKRGFRVLATDFSAGMVDKVLAYALPNLDARQMDGQALDLPDNAFDAAFSMFGIMLFPDWRTGLTEMARVVRPGGYGIAGTWKHESGAGSSVLLAEVCARLYPGLAAPIPTGMAEWREPARFEAALTSAGLIDVKIEEVTHDFLIDSVQLDDPDRWFGFTPFWPKLAVVQRREALSAIRARMPVDGSPLPIPSTALIAHARKSTS